MTQKGNEDLTLGAAALWDARKRPVLTCSSWITTPYLTYGSQMPAFVRVGSMRFTELSITSLKV